MDQVSTVVAVAAGVLGLIATLPTVIRRVRRWFRHVHLRWEGLAAARAFITRNRRRMSTVAASYHHQQLGQAAFPLSIAGKVLPVLARPSWLPEQLLPLSEVALTWRDGVPPAPVLEPGLADKLRSKCKVVIEDRPTYRLLSVSSSEGAPVLSFTLSSYEPYVETGEALALELARHLQPVSRRQVTGDLPPRLRRKLTHRNRLDPFDIASRPSTAGINTLTIVAGCPGDTSLFLVHRRGTDLAEAPGTCSVIPAGTFQPLSQNDAFHAVEFSLERNILREFGEELLNKEELVTALGALDPDEPFRVDDDLRHLSQMFAQGLARLCYLGCVLDAVTLKPELLTLLLVSHGPLAERWSTGFQDGWEGRCELVPFSREQLEHWGLRPDMAAAGQACIARCLHHYDAVGKEIEQLPG